MNKQKLYKDSPVSPIFQILLISINFIFLIIFSYFFHKNFFTLEYFPKKNTFIKYENNHILFQTKIKKIFNFNTLNGSINLGLTLTFLVEKEKLKNNPNFNPEIFLSEIFFKNAKINEKKILNINDKIDKKEFIFYYDLTVYNNFNYKLYPFNDHVFLINILIPTNTLNSTFYPTLDFYKELDLYGWDIYDNKIISTIKNEKQQIKFYLALKKHSYKTTLSIFIPLFIILFINLFSMSIGLAEGRKLIITSILALNSFKIVLENGSPKTSYFLALDFFYILFLIFSLFIFIIHILEIEMKKNFSYFIIFLFHFLILLTFIYYLKPWIKF